MNKNEKIGWIVSFLTNLSDELFEIVYNFLQRPLEEKGKDTKEILEPARIVERQQRPRKFVVRDHFKLKKDGGICSSVGENFKKRFYQVEEDWRDGGDFKFSKLKEPSTDNDIIKELGGEEKVGVLFQEISELIEDQKDGQDGPLLTDGSANVFYYWDESTSALCVVCVDWSDDGWLVDAHSVDVSDRWDGGDMVFSRNS